MMDNRNAITEKCFSSRGLPWLIGAGGLVVFLLTLSYWISLQSLGTVARVAGWLWQPEIGRPLAMIVFAPFRLLPEALVAVALNMVTAGCAALVLVQLARSALILRYDLAPGDLLRKSKSTPLTFTGPWAWLPVLLAVLACGLQLSFWEHATSASGEMLSLLCFAFTFRCVLEFRVTPEEKWLLRGVFAYAAGLTDNWLMVGYVPMFVGAIIWVKGYGACLEPRFLGRLSLGALAGLSLYLLGPMVLTLAAPDRWDFWPVLKTYLAAQKNALLVLRSQPFRLLLLTAPLPFLLLGVRWKSHTVQLADDTHQGVFVTKASGHFIHALFLVTSFWVALNPVFAPRQTELNLGLLVYYYPWALVTGYCVGYILLFGLPHGSRAAARWPVVVATLLLVAVPVTLIWKNLNPIRLTNGSALREFARQLSDDLPAGNVTVLSDESLSLMLLRAELVAQGRAKNVMLVDTRALPRPEYHQRKARDYGVRWPDVLPTNRVENIGPPELLAFVSQVASNETVVYLHPSSGLFFENYNSEPHGWIQRLTPIVPGTTNISDPKSAANQQLWQQRWIEQLEKRTAQFNKHRQHVVRWSQPAFKALRLGSRANETVTLLAGVYSKSLNHWGVQMARSGQAAAAAEWFQRAIDFDSENLAAHLNLEFMARRQKGEPERLTLAWVKKTFPNLIARFQTWPEVIGRNGPVDEPTFLLHTGRMYLGANNPRQALDAFARSTVLAPDWAGPKLWQALSQNVLGNFAASLALTDPLLAVPATLQGPGLAQLLSIRALALRQTGQTNKANAFIERFALEHQNKTEVIAAAADLHANAGQFKTELKWREILVQRDPNQFAWLVKKGYAELRLGQFEAAIITLNRALTLKPADDNARLFRAVAALQAGQLEAAKRDYLELLRHQGQAQPALFGLGTIAWREQDTNAMIRHYQAFLSNSTAATPQTAVATQRLKEWQDE
jgi:tetratricopeptide (TPR) repeat protein